MTARKQKNQEEEELKLDLMKDFGLLEMAWWTEWGEEYADDDDDSDDECIRQEKVCVSKLRCHVLLRCQLLKVKMENNLTDKRRDF